ncbi:hypothetical protein NDI85_15695 [Halomicroarcula sp. S1AR25-4]|uniref:hypothetical protein n=1 Tax=Haloarcula sp. S1AR25-4 TaxID=2950538 RepID=UPI00287594CD|nr:hypothetical protein [Halomicroarcula sp. S1AR25-4]MDS0279244.1 hypothetical protein [Halomicroarcula sp. S1AR25-4]
MPRCENCGAELETADDLEHEEVDEVTLVDEDEGPPRIQIGVDIRDVYRCKKCGKVLGVS